MKLLNNTRVPDDLIDAVVKASAHGIKGPTGKMVQTGPVVVQVNPGRGWRGTAWDYVWVRWKKRGEKRGRKRNCRGAFKVSLPVRLLTQRRRLPHRADLFKWTPEILVRHFFETSRHEWGHIADFQAPPLAAYGLEWNYDRRGIEYKEQPQESRAEDYAETAEQTHPFESFADEVQALADSMSRIYLGVEPIVKSAATPEEFVILNTIAEGYYGADRAPFDFQDDAASAMKFESRRAANAWIKRRLKFSRRSYIVVEPI